MADAYVVDSGVFVRWYIKQSGYEHALEVQAAFLSGEVALQTVDLVRFEVGNVLRKEGLLRGRIARDQYIEAVRAIDDFDILVHVTDVDALERAGRLAADRMLSFYDALVVERAQQQSLPLLTADAKLVRAAAGMVSTELLRGVG